MSTPTIDFSKYEEEAPKIDFSQYEEKKPAAPATTAEKVRHGLKEFGEQVNPVSALKGINQLFYHPIDTYKADSEQRAAILQKGKEAYEKGNYTEAAAHFMYGMIPFAGPNLERSGEQFQQGDIAGGIGSSLGQGVAMAAPEVIKGMGLPAAKGVAERLYQSALKPSTTIPPAKVASIVQTGLENKIPVSAKGLETLGALKDAVDKNIADMIASDPNRPINKFDVTARLGETAKKFQTQVNPEADLNAISEAGNEFLRNQPGEIPASQAQSLKQGTYQQLKGKAYGELKSATIESQKALARGLKEELNTAFPELADLNAQDSKLINLESVLEKAVQRNSNHQMIGIGTPLAAAGAKAVTGSTGLSAVAAALKGIVDDPVVKSRLAIALNRRGVPLPDAMARVAGYSAALGASSVDRTPNQSTNEQPQ